MPLANGLSLPNPLSNGTTADAVQVMADFNYLLAGLNRALLDAGAGAGMNAQSTQIHNLANGTSANDAINLSQLGGYALLAGATFTGSVGFTQPISTTSITASGLITGNAGFSGTTLNLSGAASLGGAVTLSSNNTSLMFTDASGTHPFFGCQNDNTYVFFGTDNVGAARLIWSVLMRNAGSALTISVPLQLNQNLACAQPLNLTGALTTGVTANSIGFLGIPSVTKTANYTLAIADVGTGINMNGAGLALAIPANASVPIPVDSVILITNINPTNNLSITITADTLTLSGTTSVGARTLGPNGEARLRKVSATSWLIAGTALS